LFVPKATYRFEYLDPDPHSPTFTRDKKFFAPKVKHCELHFSCVCVDIILTSIIITTTTIIIFINIIITIKAWSPTLLSF